METKIIKQYSKDEAKMVKWVSLACSKDGTRPILEGINISDGEIAASDGHRLHLAGPTPTAFIEGEGKTLKPVNTLSATPRPEEFELIEGTYPDYKQIVPTGEPVFEIALNKKLLADLKTMPGDAMIILSFTDPMHPVKITSPSSGAVAVIMPMHRGT